MDVVIVPSAISPDAIILAIPLNALVLHKQKLIDADAIPDTE